MAAIARCSVIHVGTFAATKVDYFLLTDTSAYVSKTLKIQSTANAPFVVQSVSLFGDAMTLAGAGAPAGSAPSTFVRSNPFSSAGEVAAFARFGVTAGGVGRGAFVSVTNPFTAMTATASA